MRRAPRRDMHARAAPLLAALASLALHAVLLTPALIGAWPHPTRNRHSQPRYLGAQSSSEGGALVVTFVDEAGGSLEDKPTPFAVALTSPSTFLIPVTLADIRPTSSIALSTDPEGRQTTDEMGQDNLGRALMFGRYVGQISARIERAWLKPRSPIAQGRFACRARIAQNRDGRVEEIELESCNGDQAWQISLVRAIQSASPLPAPPDPSVFAGRLRIQFKAELFVPGGSPEGFESESRPPVR